MKFRCIKQPEYIKGLFNQKIIKETDITIFKDYYGQIVAESDSDVIKSKDWKYVCIFNDNKCWKDYEIKFFEPIE